MVISRTARVLIAIALASWCSTKAFACTSCTRDGWPGNYSASIANCMIWNPPPNCSDGNFKRGIAFLDVLHPGLLVDSSEGTTNVSQVLDGSPAQAAGMLPGDLILQVNGKTLNDLGGSSAWGTAEDPTRSVITLKRGSEVQVVELKLISIRKVLLNNMSNGIQKASYTGNSKSQETEGPASNRPFTSGIVLSTQNEKVEVKSIMTSSPAWMAGIRPGMRVLSINGTAVSATSLHAAATMLDGYWPTKLAVRVSDGTREKVANLVTIGLSSVYSHKKDATQAQEPELLAGSVIE